MTTPHELLGIAINANSKIVKAAYHEKLREFPAHTHPTEFKAIRAAYETIKKGIISPGENLFKSGPIGISIEPEKIEELRKKLMTHLEISIEDLLKETF